MHQILNTFDRIHENPSHLFSSKLFQRSQIFALGDIRGVSYIYGLFYRFGLIDVPDKVKEKMGGKEH
ncbi:hypothetical protein FAEPRAM212_00662 [Faecalibacterium prausnitzii M21/2]|uniref:Uncharacterized protein n=1 Tax=Faecalibacterium prausnitzii M21/2 TaxID=411485 RepID=A8S868_9FIRM|nr:hypothetical protein FAEPRAM212_00662 [Faecalibacterium prausnitzii M21/2]